MAAGLVKQWDDITHVEYAAVALPLLNNARGETLLTVNQVTEFFAHASKCREITPKQKTKTGKKTEDGKTCLLYTSPSPRDQRGSRMPSSA